MEIFEYHHETATSENIALSKEETKAREIAYANWLAAKETKEAETASAKTALLDKLGITAEEARLLLA
jgi:hypothetical protein